MGKTRKTQTDRTRRTARPKAKEAPVLAFDLGGTKVAVGVVAPDGKILGEERVPVETSLGKNGLLDQLESLAKPYLKRFSAISKVGIASAGPLDPSTGVLLDPTNLFTNGKSWGVFPVAEPLSQRLKKKVIMENDAAAAVLAERWKGAAIGTQNVMILTLGTGLGTGIICNGELVRSGRGLHPEAGHITLVYGDLNAPCGCGNYGCAEAYLSGKNFESRFNRLSSSHLKGFEKNLDAQTIAMRARHEDRFAQKAFLEYGEMLAVAIQTYVVLYAPELIVLTGSFAQASDLFLLETKRQLERLLSRRRAGMDLMPRLELSALGNHTGLLGGAYVALRDK